MFGAEICRLTYLGSASVLIEAAGLRLLTDPVFDPAGATFRFGPLHWEKTTHPPIEPEALGWLDGVLLSHDQHADHLDGRGLEVLRRAPLTLTTPDGAARLGGACKGLAPWESHVLEARCGSRLRVTAAPARHGPPGTEAAMGPVTGFILGWAGQRHGEVYLSGDTVLHEGTDAIAGRGGVSLALLNIGRMRHRAFGALTFSMSAWEAAGFAQALGARTVAPLHCEGWRHFSERCSAARSALARSPIARRVVWLEPGRAREIEV